MTEEEKKIQDINDQYNKDIQDINEQCKKIEQDASKCKREWDLIDRWATNNSTLNNKEDSELDSYHKDCWQPYSPVVEPFTRSKYLKR